MFRIFLFLLTFIVSYHSLISQFVLWCSASCLLIGFNSREGKDMENKTFVLCYAHVENSASKVMRKSIILQLPLTLILQDYIHLSHGLLFLQFSRLLFIFVLK